MRQRIASAGLRYTSGSDLGALLDECRDHVLGLVGFGDPWQGHKEFASAWVDVPVIGAQRQFEVWASANPVRTSTSGRVRSSRNVQILFGCVEIPEDDSADCNALIYDDYCRIFDHLDKLGYPHLIRIWHYLPDIHRNEHGLERYKRFSLGRHEAFVSKGRTIHKDAPAASAVGISSGRTVICFLAAPSAGMPIENPRQVSAYSYPDGYGPRGPTFARALFSSWDDRTQLYISGTAAILGHLSQHEGDVGAQADETILNLRSVMEEARRQGLIDLRADIEIAFKVYLRHPEFRDIIEARLRAAFGSKPSIVYLNADICRRELLVEIEAVCSAIGHSPRDLPAR
jgi:chorismate lyase / 3-hydroxybenzoate synthase